MTKLPAAGGLAAPAIAAVAGTALTTVGGSAAAAGAITGFVGSTVGAATVIAAAGAGGAYGAGGKMAKRIGETLAHAFEAPQLSLAVMWSVAVQRCMEIVLRGRCLWLLLQIQWVIAIQPSVRLGCPEGSQRCVDPRQTAY